MRRTHGGAVSLHKRLTVSTQDRRINVNVAAKQAIAQSAIELVNDGDTLLVDSGTTALEFVRLLNPDAWLTYRKYDMATIRRLVTVLGAPDPYQGDSGPHRVKSCIARDIKDYKAMLETLAVKTGDHK